MKDVALYIKRGDEEFRNPNLSDEEFNALLEEKRVRDIRTQLAEIDRKSTRPLRSGASGTATQEDRDYLAQLDAQAAALRAQI